MKATDVCRIKLLLCIFGSLMLLMPDVAVAAGPSWRPTYDMVMKWVNFIILAAIIVKYAREPIKNFLKQQKADVVAEIDKLEIEKERIIEEIKSAHAHAEENKQRFNEMKERLIAQGEARKQQAVDQARQQGDIMIEEARKKMENRIFQAKNTLKMELADMAFEQALQRLPKLIEDKDNQRLLDLYMESLKSHGTVY